MRQKKANLLISIHADSVDNASARGASVWILSSKRVDREMNKLLEQRDKHARIYNVIVAENGQSRIHIARW